MAIGKISEDLKSAQDYLFEAQTLPQNTTTAGTAQLVGGTNGALEIKVVADTALAIADTQTITVKITGSATEGGSFTDVETIYTLTASGGNGAITAGTELGSYILTPQDPLWIKAVAITTDTGATGDIDVYIKHLAR